MVGCSLKVSGACREFAGSSPRVIRGLLGVCRELIESDRELTGNALGVRQKIIETRREFAGGYWEDHRELGRSLDTLSEKRKGLVFTCGRRSFSGLWWASTKKESKKWM
ncbi:hypothetical protein B296_00004421 [Ensete ventricosum]|uniref:Uncharacterized protein n=1 Tax=Ensete ventricosum TaxID=4639 RepID=A0A427ALE6_ENSVE|nr:hypothetical protein B296_00004421 [Ensete ventricosum]